MVQEHHGHQSWGHQTLGELGWGEDTSSPMFWTRGDIYIVILPTSILYLESHFYILNFIHVSCTYLEYMCKINREYQMKF